MTPGLRFAVLVAGGSLVAPPLALPEEPAAADTMTVRLRDLPVVEVVHWLHVQTGQGYVVDADVVDHVDVELVEITPGDVERALEALGLSISAPGPLRRVTAGGPPPPIAFSGAGFPISLAFRRGDMRDFLRLMVDATEDEVVAPAGALGRFSAFATEVPAEDILRTAVASARLELRREGVRVLVRRPAEPEAPLFPVQMSERHYGHLPYREGEAPRSRPPGLEGDLAREVKLSGLSGKGRTWMAMVVGRRGPYGPLSAGTRLYDGKLESVGPDGVVVRLDSGERIEWRLRPAAPGIARLPEDSRSALDRAGARQDAGDFGEAERMLRAALEADPHAGGDLRDALADLHYAWAQALLLRHLPLEAIRHFESAYEIDGPARPWQAGEDLNEIGFAWTDLGEPERAVPPHRQALAKPLDRHPWARAAVLNNLGSAQLALGRRPAARASFAAALTDYQTLRDRAGEGAVLNNLGALAETAGDLVEACAAYERALAASREADDRRGQAITLARIERLVGPGRPDDDGLTTCRLALAGAR